MSSTYFMPAPIAMGKEIHSAKPELAKKSQTKASMGASKRATVAGTRTTTARTQMAQTRRTQGPASETKDEVDQRSFLKKSFNRIVSSGGGCNFDTSTYHRYLLIQGIPVRLASENESAYGDIYENDPVKRSKAAAAAAAAAASSETKFTDFASQMHSLHVLKTAGFVLASQDPLEMEPVFNPAELMTVCPLTGESKPLGVSEEATQFVAGCEKSMHDMYEAQMKKRPEIEASIRERITGFKLAELERQQKERLEAVMKAAMVIGQVAKRVVELQHQKREEGLTGLMWKVVDHKKAKMTNQRFLELLVLIQSNFRNKMMRRKEKEAALAKKSGRKGRKGGKLLKKRVTKKSKAKAAAAATAAAAAGPVSTIPTEPTPTPARAALLKGTVVIPKRKRVMKKKGAKRVSKKKGTGATTGSESQSETDASMTDSSMTDPNQAPETLPTFPTVLLS